ALAARIRLEAMQTHLELAFRDREIAVERESLSLEPRAHQCEQDRRRADERCHAKAASVGGPNERRTRIRHRWGSGFGEDAGVAACEHRFEELRDPRRVGARLEPVALKWGERQRMPNRLEKGARALWLFGDEITDRSDPLLHAGRDRRIDRGLSEQRRDQIERAGAAHAGT